MYIKTEQIKKTAGKIKKLKSSKSQIFMRVWILFLIFNGSSFVSARESNSTFKDSEEIEVQIIVHVCGSQNTMLKLLTISKQ